MYQYIEALIHVRTNGTHRIDRTGTGAFSVFGYQNRYDLSKGFPLVTTKKMFWKGIVHELLWFIRGDTNIKYLQDNGIHIWDAWADARGNLGPIYGKQWRSWPDQHGDPIDQLQNVIDELKSNAYSRRHIVSAWNVSQLDEMALPPCHLLFQFYSEPLKGEHLKNWAWNWSDLSLTREEIYNMSTDQLRYALHAERIDIPDRLSLQLYQRSADIFLGVPFNIASYSLLLHMVAKLTGHVVGDFVHSFGDLHLYADHVEQAQQQVVRDPYPLPEVYLRRVPERIEDFTADDIVLINYRHHDAIKAPISV